MEQFSGPRCRTTISTHSSGRNIRSQFTDRRTAANTASACGSATHEIQFFRFRHRPGM
jgi:hypothetical protein